MVKEPSSQSASGEPSNVPVTISSGNAPVSVRSHDVEDSAATSDPYSLSREPERLRAPVKPGKGKQVRNALGGAPVRDKTKKEEKFEQRTEPPSESADYEESRRSRPNLGPSKVEDDDEDEDDEDYEEDSDDILPEAQPAHPRNDVDAKTGRFRSSAVHVYGLDFLKTGHMDEIFSQFNHKFVEWINDSAANVIFGDERSAKKALESLSFPKIGDEPWRRTPDILVSEDVPPIFLQMRLACSTDAKRAKKATPTVLPSDRWGAPSRRNRAGGKGKGKQREKESEDKDEDGLSTRRPKAPLTEEERALRQKRATRFKDWLVQAVEASQSKEKEPTPKTPKATVRKVPMEAFETTEEEKAKRRKRMERFGADNVSGTTPAVAPEAEKKQSEEQAQKEAATTAAAPEAETSAAPAKA